MFNDNFEAYATIFIAISSILTFIIIMSMVILGKEGSKKIRISAGVTLIVLVFVFLIIADMAYFILPAIVMVIYYIFHP